MNAVPRKVIGTAPARGRFLSWGDVLILIALMVVLFAGLRLASPTLVVGPDIDLSPSSLPWYTMLSLGRLTASYALSILFSLVYGYIAARSRAAERIMLPVLDVLQSVPILSFLPVVVLRAKAG